MGQKGQFRSIRFGQLSLRRPLNQAHGSVIENILAMGAIRIFVQASEVLPKTGLSVCS